MNTAGQRTCCRCGQAEADPLPGLDAEDPLPDARLQAIQQRLHMMEARAVTADNENYSCGDLTVREVRDLLDLLAALQRYARTVEQLQLQKGLMPDGTLCCGGCGGPHQFDTSIPSVVWNEVIRAQGLSEFLCLSCIVREFAKVGKSFTAALYRTDLGFHGVQIEIQINSQPATDAFAVQEENNALRWKLHEAEVERAAADARGVRLQPYVQHKPECAIVRPRQFSGVTLGEGGTCACGLADLLATADGPPQRPTEAVRTTAPERKEEDAEPPTWMGYPLTWGDEG